MQSDHYTPPLYFTWADFSRAFDTNNANNATAANAVSGFGSGMILAGLALTGGVIFLALQGQKTSYAGGATRRRKKRRDADD